MNNSISLPECMHGNDIFVLIHGATQCSMSWMPVALILNRLGHKAIAVDLPGHGSDLAKINEQTINSYAQRVIKIVQAQTKPVILCGHSMGGGVITEAAELCADHVKKLVYVAAHMPLPNHSCNGLHDSSQPIDWYSMSEDGDTVSPAALLKNKGQVEKPETKMAKIDREWIARFCGNEAIAPITTPLHHTKERWGTIPRFYVQTMQDFDLWTKLQQTYIDYWGCEAVYRMNCDHDVLLAAPEMLAFILHHIAIS